MRRKKGLRRSLLLDSSRKRTPAKNKRNRNRFLNFFAGFSSLSGLKKVFKFSFITGLVLTGMSIFLVFAIFSPYYKLKTISVPNGSKNIPSEVIENISSKFLGESMFFLQKENVRNLLQNKFPEITNVAVSEKWPSEIEISVEIAPAKFNIFDEESANFSTITDRGIILSNSSNEGLPVIKLKQYGKLLNTHTNIISEDWLNKISFAKNILFEEIKIPIKDSTLLMKSREIHFSMNDGGVIWIDLSQPIESQLKKLILAEGKIKLYSKKFEHIDLRIPKQIFWKWQ